MPMPAPITCRRAGCPRPRSHNLTTGTVRPYCSLLCATWSRELDNLERICRNATNHQAAELWSAAVDVGDRLSYLFTLKHALRPPREDHHQ